MIARLKGIIDELGLDWLVIDVAGVGYMVSCPTRTINLLPGVGLPVDLFIETHVRESQISLFGFENSRERECFRVLTTVQGVGARVALSILGSLSPDQLVEAIYSQDKAKSSLPMCTPVNVEDTYFAHVFEKYMFCGLPETFLLGRIIEIP